MNWVWKITAAALGGFLAYSVGAVLGAMTTQAGAGTGVATFVGGASLVIAVLLALTAERGAKAWRRVFLFCALMAFALPLFSFVSGIVGVADTAGKTAAESAGAMLGSGVITAMSGFIGFFAGAIFLVIGLLVGRDKQVIIVQQAAH